MKKARGKWNEADCAICVPPLMEENQDALDVYRLCRDQLIVGVGGAIAINHLAVMAVMDLYEITNPPVRRRCFEKVAALSAHIIKLERDRDGDA